MFLIKYFEHCKEASDCSEEHIRKLFKINPQTEIFLQYFNEKYKTFIDCSFGCSADNSTIFKVCEEKNVSKSRPSSQTFENEPSAAETEVMETSIHLDSLDVHQENHNDSFETVIVADIYDHGNEDQSSNFPIFNETDGTLNIARLKRQNAMLPGKCELSTNIASENISTNSCLLVDGLVYGSLPTNYTLPDINPDSKLGRALESKSVLSKSLKTQFLDKIFQTFAAKKIFYLGSQCQDVTHAILSKYPHLGMGLPYKSAKELWAKILYGKFYNAKKREFSDDDDVKDAKSAKRCKLGIVKPSALESRYGIPNYKPAETPDDEDSMMIESHISWMKLEWKKSDRNESAIAKRMRATFAHRRGLLFDHESIPHTLQRSSAEILKQYPCLRMQSQAILELALLFDQDFYTCYEQNITKFAVALTDSVTSSKNKHKPYLDDLFDSSNIKEHEKLSLVKVVGNTALLLSEDPNEAICKHMSDKCSPILIVKGNGDVELFVDNSLYISPISPINCALLWVASFLFFNIDVPPKIKKTFEILQHLFLKVPRSGKINQSILKIINLFKKC